MTRIWSQREIEDFLARERLAYQRIELPFGLATPGDARPGFCDEVFADVSGKSVLDVGSYLGYFCQEALRRGASSAQGLEVDPEKIRQARALAEMNGVAPEFTQADIETYAFDRSYDVVLCLNVLHHLFDPIGVLRRLAGVARRQLVLEVASLNPRDGRKLRVGPLARRMLERQPVIFAAPGLADPEQRTNAQKFFFTPRAVENILRHHTKRFSQVETKPSGFKQRFVVRATTRRIGRLLVVSGLTSSGKTTFLERLAAHALPERVRSLLPAGCEEWPQLSAADLSREPVRARDGTLVDVAQLGGLCLEYDVLRPLEGATHAFERDQVLDLLGVADEVVVVLLDPGAARLAEQYALGRGSARAGRKRQRWHEEQLRGQLADPEFSRAWLARWKMYLESHHPGSRLVTAELPAGD